MRTAIRKVIAVASLVSTLAALGVSQQQVFAQVVVEDTLRGGAICMVRPTAEGEMFWILAPARDVAGMTANGFSPGPCKIAMGTATKREEYRDVICGIASSWREDLQFHFEKTRGERPAVLCGMAEMVVGQWTREGRN